MPPGIRAASRAVEHLQHNITRGETGGGQHHLPIRSTIGRGRRGLSESAEAKTFTLAVSSQCAPRTALLTHPHSTWLKRERPNARTSHAPQDAFTRRAHGAAPPIVARVRPRMGEPSTPIPRNAHAQNKWHAHTGCTISQTQQVNKRSRQLLLILNKNFWRLR